MGKRDWIFLAMELYPGRNYNSRTEKMKVMWGETHANFWVGKMRFFYLRVKIYLSCINIFLGQRIFWKIDPGQINFCFGMTKESFSWIRNHYVFLLAYFHFLSARPCIGHFWPTNGHQVVLKSPLHGLSSFHFY